MKRNHSGSKGSSRTIQVWTYPQAKAAVPYIATLMRTIRERRLEALNHHLNATRLAKRTGRPDRSALIAHEEALRQAQLADSSLQEATEELQALDIYCQDPVAGLAVVPFVQDEKLAWFIYDLFDEAPFRSWRFHSDDIDTRRPIAEVLQGVEP